MEKKVVELEQQVNDFLNQAEHVDESEDIQYGKGKNGSDLPKELKFRQSRLQKSQEAKKALEEAKADAALKHREHQAKKQKKITDPESRIMPVSVVPRGRLPKDAIMQASLVLIVLLFFTRF